MVVRGTNGADVVDVGRSGGSVAVSGLSPRVEIAGSEAAHDVVTVATLDGADTVRTGVGISGPAAVYVEGGHDPDTLDYAGTGGPDTIGVAANVASANIHDGTSTPVEAVGVESVVVAGLAGADTIGAVGNLAGLTTLTFDGGEGADTLHGGNGADVLLGGKGPDVVDGNQGSDDVRLGDGDDRFEWTPGDGSDTVEGGPGNDALDVFGSAAGELVGLSAVNGRLRFSREIGSVALDVDDTESVRFRAFGGADTVTVADLTGTDTGAVELELDAAAGGGDGQVDTAIVYGTAGADEASVGGSDGRVELAGLAARVRIAGAEEQDQLVLATLGGADTITAGSGVPGPAAVVVAGGDETDTLRYLGTAGPDEIAVAAHGGKVAVVREGSARIDAILDRVVVAGLAGADTIAAVGNLAPLTTLTLDGGEGDDELHGGNGADLLLGGNGNDAVDGNQGSDAIHLGDGDDRFAWSPGDGSDGVDGGPGGDLLDFFGSSTSERIVAAANGDRLQLTRNVGGVFLDVVAVEHLAVFAFGGSDAVEVGDLGGTGVTTVDAGLGLLDGSPDGQPDTVILSGTPNRDVLHVSAAGSTVVASGLAALLRVDGSDGPGDTLRVRTLGGDDDVTVAPGVSGLITPIVELGDGE